MKNKTIIRNNLKQVLVLFGFYLLFVMAFTPINVFADDNGTATDEEKIQAVREVALAYYYKGTELQFDDYAMTYQNMRRENRNLVLEDIAPQDIQHTTCSFFATNIFTEAFLDRNGNNYRFNKSFTYELVDLANPESTAYKENIAVDYIILTGE